MGRLPHPDQGVTQCACFLTSRFNALVLPKMTGARDNMPNPEPTLGVAGIALLPDRDTPDKIHYLMTLTRAKRELGKHLGSARAQAAAAVAALAHDNAAADRATANQLLAFLNHSKGPLFQAALLTALKYSEIEVVHYPEQSALDYVREIATGIAVGINCHPRELILWASNTVHKPRDMDAGASTTEQLAALFLANTAALNRADPRFAEAQRLVDDATVAASQASAHDAERITTAAENARNAVAAQIRSGAISTTQGDIAHAPLATRAVGTTITTPATAVAAPSAKRA